MALFKRGYEKVREEKERQEKQAEQRKNSLFEFFLKDDGEEATVRFLTEEPVTFYEHKIPSYRNGKEFYDSVICTTDITGECKYCDDGNNASFSGAFLVFDRREFEVEDKKTKKKKVVNGSLKLFIKGTRILSQLDRLSSKYGLTNRDYTITRVGKGTATTYTFDREEEEKLTKKEIEEMLPENLRKLFDGTQESLMKIVEKQLEGRMEDIEDDEEDLEDDNDVMVSLDDEEEKQEKKKSSTKSLFKKKK